MSQYIGATLLAIGIYAVLCVPVGMMNTALFKAIRGEKISGNESVKAYTPFANIAYGRKLLYGSTAYVYGLYVAGALLAFRAVALLAISVAPVLIVFSAFTVIASITLYAILYISNAVSMCSLLRGGAALMVISIVLAPVAYYLLSVRVPRYFKSVEDEVSGRFNSED